MLLYFILLCKGIQDSLDSGFHAVDSGFQVLVIILLNELTKSPQAKMSRTHYPSSNCSSWVIFFEQQIDQRSGERIISD